MMSEVIPPSSLAAVALKLASFEADFIYIYLGTIISKELKISSFASSCSK